MIGNFVTSLIRTAVPMIVGWLLGLPIIPAVLSAFGVDTQRATEIAGGLVYFGLAFAFYWLARTLEHRWPKVGVLLGIPARPVYPSGMQAIEHPADGTMSPPISNP